MTFNQENSTNRIKQRDERGEYNGERKAYISFLRILGLWVGDSTAATGKNDRQGRRGIGV